MGRYGTVRRHLGEEAVSPRKLGLPLLNGSYLREFFNYQPITSGVLGHEPPSGVDTESFRVHVKSGAPLLGTYIGTGTQLAPLFTAGKLQVSLDEVASDGVEYNPGITQLGATCYGPMVLVRGAAAPHFVRGKFTIATVANISYLALGYREEAAVAPVLDNYQELAAINLALGDVKTETISNNGATVTTDTLVNVGNATEFELKVVLDQFKARFFIDGVEKGSKFTFHSSALRLIPFVHIFQKAAGAGSVVECSELEAGYLADVDDHYIL